MKVLKIPEMKSMLMKVLKVQVVMRAKMQAMLVAVQP